ncbi:MAG: LysM peptidoglycan-binding domain-containing protein [Chlamydiales bacterium]
MNRKDLIIVAVLINAGLMAVFFVSALKSDGSTDEIAVANSSLPSAISEIKMVRDASSPTDEIDQMLKEHHQNLLPTSAVSAASANPALPTTAPLTAPMSAPNFADDLKAISFPENSAVVAPVVPPLAAAPTVSTSEVTVKKGDVLEKIARLNGVSVEELMKANHLATTRLKIGQKLQIPAKSGGKSSSTAAHSSFPKADESGAQYYIVKNGDNPWTIAVKNRLKVEELLKLNELDEEKARRLKPGDKLRIR